ncbi:RNA 2',3'-cyclic phosphodiesterase [bacterium (Candidatus Torokbacteria) CG_4_10_14_0_2_um_filter_35_8]|nr:MAG: RNA 2',3'-cyclic phosphodiesterase [bacterium (Candidatus Torokbacteria) CG_4_10_14_0_2_um_filter_35_8]
MPRIFIAINFPPAAKKELENLIKALQAYNLPIKWADSNIIHLTLNFLGDLNNQEITQAGEIISSIVKNYSKLPLTIGNQLDAFPKKRKPSVIILKIHPEPNLIKLQNQLTCELKRAKIGNIEERKYIPHLTLGRVGGWEIKLSENFWKEKLSQNLTFNITSIDIMKSKLFPEGPQHQIIKKFALL